MTTREKSSYQEKMHREHYKVIYISHKIDSHKKKNQEKSVLILKTFKLFIIKTQHLNTSKQQTSNQL